MKKVRALSAIIGIVLIIGTGGEVLAQTASNPSITGYYVTINGNATGPYDTSGLRQLISAGQLTRNSFVWKAGMQNWVVASTVRELESLFSATPPPPPQTTPPPPPQTTQPPVSQQQASYDGGSFELGVTYYMNNYEGRSVSGVGINIADVIYFNNTIGLGSYANLIYCTADNVNAVSGNALIGPSFRLLRTDQFSIPIAIGVFLEYSYAFSSYASGSGFNMGAGGNLTAEIKLTQKVHLYGRIQFAYGFFDGSVYIIPSFGVGF